MQKQCSRCQITKPFSDFLRRAAAHDGLTAACGGCLREVKKTDYLLKDREKTLARVKQNKQDRFERDPAYKRAFYLWGTTKKRTKIPPWVSITDFVPICRKALKLGPEYEIDHVVPLKGKLVCGLHVPQNLRVVLRKTNQTKRNKFVCIS